MSEEEYIPVKLPFGNKVPTAYDIVERFKKLYPNTYKPLLPLLTSCAEEAETIMQRLFVKADKQELTVRAMSTKNNHRRITGYRCPSCRYDKIMIDFKHCPNCARPISWDYGVNLKKAA